MKTLSPQKKIPTETIFRKDRRNTSAEEKHVKEQDKQSAAEKTKHEVHYHEKSFAVGKSRRRKHVAKVHHSKEASK